jgi:type IV pilus assembly protein PilP
MNASKILISVFALASLSACSPSKDYSDLNAFMDEVDSRPRGRIEPLPPIETIPPFSYLASNQRSPFEPPVVLKRVDRQDGPKVTPDFNRVKQFLEQYAISQLAMVGTLAQGPVVFGLIQDGDGGVHRVQAGDFMGTDHGKIQNVGDTSIELIEIVPDGTGGWVERERTVSLATGA